LDLIVEQEFVPSANTEDVATQLLPVNAKMVGLDLIVLSKYVKLNVVRMDIVTMEHATAKQDSQEIIVHYLLVLHPALEMVSVSW